MRFFRGVAVKRTPVVLMIAAMVFICACSSRNNAGREAIAAEKEPAAEKVFTCSSAGRWYPGNADQLRTLVDGHLKEVEKKDVGGKIIALISPHAGLQISGPVAAYGYKQIEGMSFDVVAVVGFTHGMYDPNIGVYAEGSFRTPLGDIPVDEDAAKELIAAHGRIISGERFFYGEHSLDNQLPYLQRTLKSFRLLPILLGSQTEDNIKVLAAALAKVLKGKNALIVASTDLSHYWMYDEANRLDAEIIGRIKNFDNDGIAGIMAPDPTGKRMCGHGAVRAVMLAAQALGADKVEALKSANSQDTYGGGERGVVGYLSAAFVDTDNSGPVETEYGEDADREEESTMSNEKQDGELGVDDRKEILEITRKSLETYIKTGKKIKAETDNPALQVKRGMFVTLEKKGRLRGCMGHFENDTPIGRLAASQVLVSATQDPRFPDVTPDELDDIDLELSILSVPAPVDSYEDIVVGKHGVILQKRGRGATFLPQVAPDQGWDRDTMLEHLAMKAGLPGDGWKEGASFLVYTAEVFGEEDME